MTVDAMAVSSMPCPSSGGDAPQIGHLNDAGQGGSDADEHEVGDADAVGVDTGQAGRFLIAARGVNLKPVAGFMKDEACDEGYGQNQRAGTGRLRKVRAPVTL